MRIAKIKLLLASACCLMLGTFSMQTTAGTIVGSAHDFSDDGWAGGEICIACHTPHNADISVGDAPLWNHAVTNKVFALYTSPTLDAAVAQPDGSSKLCLSCHDGTVALDSFGTTTGTLFMSGAEAVGADELSNDHPISFVYDTALAGADGSLFDPADTTRTITVGAGADSKQGTLDAVMLLGGKLQCASCHDVHNKFTNGPVLLKIANTGSALCLTCHNK
jgi:predicted CXXCH cytochrome family protein